MNLSPFHQELFSLLEKNAKTHAEDSEFQKFHHLLKEKNLNEIVDNYQHIWNEYSSQQIEREWMSAFSEKEFIDLGLAPYFPKIYRALPRLYHRDDPSRYRIKKNFTRLSDLKRLSVDRAIFSLYEGKLETSRAKVGIVTHVLSDGLGDWIAAVEAASILAKKFPSLEIHLFALSDRELPKEDFPFQVHLFSKEDPPMLLNEMDFLLQIPTLFPDLIALRPKVEKIGEYGFLESDWFHPKSGNRSMGLHVLEKGIFTKKIGPASFAEIEQKRLLTILFGIETPGPIEIEAYRATHQFHFAYLATPIGGMVYLVSLLKMREWDEKDIDLCSPSLDWLIDADFSHLNAFGVKEIQIYFQQSVHRMAISEKGKTIRIICPGPITSADMKRILFLSEEWVAVRGNQSLSEAISTKKAFFYDGKEHSRYLVKDLIALAENRLKGHRGALHAFRMMGQAFIWNLPDDESEWVEESFFQKEDKLPWLTIANELGFSLQDGDTIVGFKKLSTHILEEHSFNDFLCHLVERELVHQTNPQTAQVEEELMSLYTTGEIPFSTLVKNLRTCIVQK